MKHNADGDGVDGLCCEPTYAGWPPCIDDLLFIFFCSYAFRSWLVFSLSLCHSPLCYFDLILIGGDYQHAFVSLLFNGFIEVLISHTIIQRFELNSSVVVTFRFVFHSIGIGTGARTNKNKIISFSCSFFGQSLSHTCEPFNRTTNKCRATDSILRSNSAVWH